MDKTYMTTLGPIQLTTDERRLLDENSQVSIESIHFDFVAGRAVWAVNFRGARRRIVTTLERGLQSWPDAQERPQPRDQRYSQVIVLDGKLLPKEFISREDALTFVEEEFPEVYYGHTNIRWSVEPKGSGNIFDGVTT
jgi:hypothetical protein